MDHQSSAAGISQEPLLHSCTAAQFGGCMGSLAPDEHSSGTGLLLTGQAHLAQHTGEALGWAGAQALVFHSRV